MFKDLESKAENIIKATVAQDATGYIRTPMPSDFQKYEQTGLMPNPKPLGFPTSTIEQRAEMNLNKTKAQSDVFAIQQTNMTAPKSLNQSIETVPEYAKFKGDETQWLQMELKKGKGGNGKKMEENRADISYDIMKALYEAGVTDKDAQLNILANIQHESAFDWQKMEDMNYKPDSIIQVRPEAFGAKKQKVGVNSKGQPIYKYVASPEGMKKAKELTDKGPLEVAKFMYGNKMGNVDPNDAAKYRGRGLIQLTGRASYKQFNDFLKSRGINADVLKEPDLVNKNKDIAVQSVLFHFLRKAPVERLNTEGRDIERMTRWVGPANIQKKIEERRASVLAAKKNKTYDEFYDRLINEKNNGFQALQSLGGSY